jgi:hypothetical protein
LALALEFSGNTHQVSRQVRRDVMSQQSDEDRVSEQAHHEMTQTGSSHADRGSTGSRTRGVLVVLLGAAIVLGLGYVLLSADPSPASVSWSDGGPDQSTGPTDPNGPQH